MLRWPGGQVIEDSVLRWPGDIGQRVEVAR